MINDPSKMEGFFNTRNTVLKAFVRCKVNAGKPYVVYLPQKTFKGTPFGT
jgi:hypothetical protein